MLVSLYTSRTILIALGVEDYGIYNVVGGIVTMFQMFSGSLTAAITRFITYELGTNNSNKLKSVFSASVTIQILLSGFIILFAETIGLWFLNEKMTIPTDRVFATHWVYQFSVITFTINLISVPYNAAIIAHEKMAAFAYIGIIDAIGRLIIAFMVMYSPFDCLIYYGFLMCILAVSIRFLYTKYCKKNFEECEYHFIWNKYLLKEIFTFAGWNFIGSTSAILREHGGNILINMFFGPTVNAAKGISAQVNSAVSAFTNNFMTAVQPQITKSYASGNSTYMLSLLFQSIRYSFYLLLILTLPIFLRTNYILNIWLKEVPDYTDIFIQLTLVFTLCEAMSHPLVTAMLATGKIRNYQIIVGGIQMMNLPISYILLKLKFDAPCVLITSIIISQCCLVARLIMLRPLIGLNILFFIKDVYLNMIVVGGVSLMFPLWINTYLSQNTMGFFTVSLISFLSTMTTIFILGCNTKERLFIISKVNAITHKKWPHND